MTMVVSDPWLENQIREQREATGVDRYDEVWEGVYMMAPLPNDEHQHIVTRLSYILEDILGVAGLALVRAGVNLSDRSADWEHDYRGPDVAVFHRDGGAENLGTHWRGPADFLVEITSPHDHTREKLPFYGRLGVVELLIVDRDPWQLELYRHDSGEMKLAGRSTVDDAATLESGSVPLSFQLVSVEDCPQIRITHAESGRTWMV